MLHEENDLEARKVALAHSVELFGPRDPVEIVKDAEAFLGFLCPVIAPAQSKTA